MVLFQYCFSVVNSTIQWYCFTVFLFLGVCSRKSNSPETPVAHSHVINFSSDVSKRIKYFILVLYLLQALCIRLLNLFLKHPNRYLSLSLSPKYTCRHIRLVTVQKVFDTKVANMAWDLHFLLKQIYGFDAFIILIIDVNNQDGMMLLGTSSMNVHEITKL